jgi:hypothetical protein
MNTSRYNELDRLLTNIVGDLDILSGDVLGPSDVTWQDVAGTLAVNMRVYARRLEEARQDGGGIVFPSIREKLADS